MVYELTSLILELAILVVVTLEWLEAKKATRLMELQIGDKKVKRLLRRIGRER